MVPFDLLTGCEINWSYHPNTEWAATTSQLEVEWFSLD
jgi:hypothetical protein